TRLGDPARALGQLEQVLENEATNRDAREVVEKCLEIPTLRARAAVVLEAAYVALDSPRDLVRMLEIRLETASGRDERRELLRRIAELRDERLNEGALEAYARFVPLAPEDVRARERVIEL